jgi:DNA-binding NarL/FixJ family response regulator
MHHAKHSVLIVEDQCPTASRLQRGVNRCDSLAAVKIAPTLADGIDSLYTCKPRIVLVDLGLPDGDGIELVRVAREVNWRCEAIVVSVFGDERRIVSAIRAGARGYLLKTSSLDDIGKEITTVIDGGSPISPQIARRLLSIIRDSQIHAAPQSGAAILTVREQEILMHVARGYKRQEIAEMLTITVGTVGNHINSIYRKLEVRSSTEALAKAKGMGLL